MNFDEGRRQRVEVGPLCGLSNVHYWLDERGVEPPPGLVEAIDASAKSSIANLEDEEVWQICRQLGRVRVSA